MDEYSKLDEYAQKYLNSKSILDKYYNEVRYLDEAVTSNNFLQLYEIQYYTDGRVVNNCIPVAIYVTPRYPYLSNTCSFYFNLHQGYDTYGILETGAHEYEGQTGRITYDQSYAGTTASWTLRIDMSLQPLDATLHDMNPFNVNLVQYSDISGSVKY